MSIPSRQYWAVGNHDTRREPSQEARYRLTFDIGADGRNMSREERAQLVREVRWSPAQPSVQGGYHGRRGRTTATPRQPGSRPTALVEWGGFGLGTFLGGLVAVIVAVILHDAACPNALCNTGLGELGQAFSGTARTDCGAAAVAEDAVGWLVIVGVVGMVTGLGKAVLGLTMVSRSAKQAQRRNSAGSTRPANPAPSSSPVHGSPPSVDARGHVKRGDGG